MLNLINLKQFAKNKLFATSLVSVSCFGLLANTVPVRANTPEISAEIAPGSISKEVGNAQTLELERTVTIDLSDFVETIVEQGAPAAPEKLDILFLADNTGSMTAPISNVISNAQSLLSALETAYGSTAGGDMQVGVAFYRDDPSGYGQPGETYSTGVSLGTTTQTTTQLGVVGTQDFKKTWEKIRRGRWATKYSVTTTNETTGAVVKSRIKWQQHGLDGQEVTWTEDVFGDVEVEVQVPVYEQLPLETKAYKLLEPVNGGSIADAVAAIGQWQAQYENANNTYPEGNFFALHQAATSGAAISGYATGYNTQWREDSDKRIIVMFGDAESITSTANLSDVVNALNNNNITVVAINVEDNGTPEWAEFNSDNQFYSANENTTTITSATNGVYADSYSNGIADTMLDLVETAAVVQTEIVTVIQPDPINIFFRTAATTPVPVGLTVDYVCTAPLPDKCNNVANGETRTFKVIVTGINPGDYNFETEVFDVDTDHELVDAGNNILIRKVD